MGYLYRSSSTGVRDGHRNFRFTTRMDARLAEAFPPLSILKPC